MSLRTFHLAMLVALATGCASAPAADSPSAPARVVEEVETFMAHYIATQESGDEAAIRELYVDDERFAWYTDGAKSYGSPDEVIAGLRRFAEVRFTTTLSDTTVVPLGDTLASAHTRFQTQLSIPDADDHEFGGVVTLLLEKDVTAGVWRILLGHTSTPSGPPRDGA